MHFSRRIMTLAVTAVLALAAPAHANSDTRFVSNTPSVHVISNDRGGSISRYAQEVQRLRGQNKLVAFTGQCASACTMFLALGTNRTCIAPGASFVFHQAHGASPRQNQWGTETMVDHYPSWVRDWIARNGGMSQRLIRMDYTYAARFMRSCRASSA